MENDVTHEFAMMSKMELWGNKFSVEKVLGQLPFSVFVSILAHHGRFVNTPSNEMAFKFDTKKNDRGG